MCPGGPHILEVAHGMKHGGLETAEREVETVSDEGSGEGERVLARPGQLLDHRAAGVAQSQHARHLVERFARRIVPCLAQHPVPSPAGHVEQERVSSGYDQRDERRLERGVLERRRKHMSLEMVHADQRRMLGDGQRLGVAHADEQGPDQAGAGGDGDRIDGVERDPGLPQGPIHHGAKSGDVGAARQFGDHTAEDGMDVLGENHQAREFEARPVPHQHRSRGLVARRLDAEHHVNHGVSGARQRCREWRTPSCRLAA